MRGFSSIHILPGVQFFSPLLKGKSFTLLRPLIPPSFFFFHDSLNPVLFSSPALNPHIFSQY